MDEANSRKSMNSILLDLWGGEHRLDKTTLNYRVERECGLFSNMTVVMYGIMKYYALGYLPKTISLYLTEYKSDYDFYHDLFKQNDTHLDFDEVSEQEMFNFFRYGEPNRLGLGRRKSEVNFSILSKILVKYFTLSDISHQTINKIIAKHNIDLSNTVFIWARKTDKIYESKIPTAETYINILTKNNLINKRIILQTDDISVLSEFRSLKLNFSTLEEIPYSKSNDDGTSNSSQGFHSRMATRYNDQEFIDKYYISKVEYLQTLLALSKIASMCEYSIVYPGCLTTLIPIFKNSFSNQFSFIDDIGLIE